VLTTRKGTLRITAVALGLSLVLAACGGDDDNEAASASTTGAAPTSASATGDASPSATESGSPSASVAESPSAAASPTEGGDGKLSGTLSGDGSSTVFPIMEGVAEDLKAKGLTINVGQSGTGGGFEKFCAGQTDFSNASRAIKDEEKAACDKAGVKFEEFQVASDGLAIVSSKETAIDCLSIDELKKTFGTGSTVKKGTDIRPDLPADDLKLFTPGADSGTYDFFAEEVLDKGKFRADDVTTSEDDNVLVTGISGTKGGLGFFGFAYFQENEAKLNLIGVKGDGECVKPSAETVLDGSYPLSRPLFIYVKKESLAKPEAKAMMEYVLGDEGRAITTEVGYVELEDKDYADQLAKLGA
jgi:phosphate transport system substrate-binding protein